MSETLAEDWIVLWQSELTAMAADRELRESWVALVALWGSSTQAALSRLRTAHERAGGTAGAAEPAGAAAVAAASVAGVDEVERLHRRIAELERRLADLERDGGAG